MNPKLLSILFLLWCALFTGGLYFNQTKPLPPSALTANGYGGPIRMQMSLSDNGDIASLRILEHNETSSYVDHLKDFLEQFIGKKSQSPLILGRDIDAISGATITSNAITTAVRHQRATLLREPNSEKIPKRLSIKEIIIPLLLTIFAILAFATRDNPLRWAIMIGAALYFGFINHTMLSIIQVAQAIMGHAPTFVQSALWWMILGISLITALIIGRLYCGNLCPFAAVQEILFQLKFRRGITPPTISPAINKNSRIIKYILLFIIPATALCLGSSAPANIEPFITLFAGHGSKLAWLLLAMMLALAIFNFRFWCKYLCPIGALTGLTALFNIFRIKPTPACTGCGTCRKICPMEAIDANTKGIPRIDTSECIVCGKCLRACASKALAIQGPGHDKT